VELVTAIALPARLATTQPVDAANPVLAIAVVFAVAVVVLVLIVVFAIAVVVFILVVGLPVVVNVVVFPVLLAITVDIPVLTIHLAVAVHVVILGVRHAVSVQVAAVCRIVGVRAVEKFVNVFGAVSIGVEEQHQVAIVVVVIRRYRLIGR